MSSHEACKMAEKPGQNAQNTSQYFTDAHIELISEDSILTRTLNVTSIVAEASSFAQRAAATVPELQNAVEIGSGLQGAIFEQIGKPLAMKKELPGNDRLPTNLRHEYAIHSAVLSAFDKFEGIVGSNVHVPRLFSIIDDQDRFWAENLKFFPVEHRAPGTLVEMERILPLPKTTRRALIKHFYPHENETQDQTSTISRILSETSNKHCLVRTYLGRDETTYSKDKFSLRNFPLYLKSMEDFKLDVHGLATSMGRAFAIMHWGAGADGDDVEFVLGTETVEADDGSIGIQHLATGFYLLDFGQCDEVDLENTDCEAVYQAFKGAMVTGDNQLFIPNCLRNAGLFTSFKIGYSNAAVAILQARGLENKFNVRDFMAEYQAYAEDFL